MEKLMWEGFQSPGDLQAFSESSYITVLDLLAKFMSTS